MDTRARVTQFLLWFSVLALAIWWGGTIYQMAVIVPLWSASPPESVRQFFLGTRYNQTIWNFFGPPFMVMRGLPVVLLALLGWNLPIHRKYFLTALVTMVFGLIFTWAYIYPINLVLFLQAGGNHTAEEIRAMASKWILADRLRFAVMSVGFLALLRALSVPFSRQSQR
jgi:hypothetical protein